MAKILLLKRKTRIRGDYSDLHTGRGIAQTNYYSTQDRGRLMRK